MTKKTISMPQQPAFEAKQTIVIKAKDRLYLNSQRPMAEKAIAGLPFQGLFLNDLHRIHTAYFVPPFPLQAMNYEHIGIWLGDLYQHYDAWLITAPPPSSVPEPLKEISKHVLDTQRPAAESFLKNLHSRTLDVYGLCAIMQDEFNPNYHYNSSDDEQPSKMIQELYKLYDERMTLEAAGKKQ